MTKQPFFLMGLNPLGNAEVMLDVCRLEYEKAGRGADVQELKELTVRDADSSRLALLTVWNLPEDRNVRDIKRFTVRALRVAVAKTAHERDMNTRLNLMLAS